MTKKRLKFKESVKNGQINLKKTDILHDLFQNEKNLRYNILENNLNEKELNKGQDINRNMYRQKLT